MKEIDEASLEANYWAFDEERSRTGAERDAFKHKVRALLRGMTGTSGKYEAIGGEIGRLVDEKQRAYGRSFDRSGEIVKILYPSGISPGQYQDVLAIVRILDKFFRLATHAQDPMGENPWQDVAGYAILMNRDLLAQQDPEEANV